ISIILSYSPPYFLRTPPPPRSPLFPYTTLFRSGQAEDDDVHDLEDVHISRDSRRLRVRERGRRVRQDRRQAPYAAVVVVGGEGRSEEHTSELQSRFDLVCRLLLEKKNEVHFFHY